MYILACTLIRLIYREELREDIGFIEMFLDRVNGASQRAALAENYAATNPVHPETAKLVFLNILPKNVSMARKIYALQAADFVAAECRRDMEGKDNWFESREDGLSGKDYDRFNHPHWPDEEGRLWAFPRRSMSAFMQEAKVTLGGFTYDLLLQENEFRKGVWTRTLHQKNQHQPSLAARPS
jgi:hypothetical protein